MDFLDLLKPVQAKGMSALEISARESAFVYIKNPHEKRPEVKVNKNLVGYNNPKELRDNLFELVTDNNLFGANCNLVLHPADNRLLLIDRPNVMDGEMAQAAKWQVKDMITDPLDDVVVDVFSPPSRLAQMKNKIYAVIASQKRLQEYFTLLESCELNPVCIDIHELAVRNILERLTGSLPRPIAFMQLFDGHCELLIYQQGALNFIRRVDLNPFKTYEERTGALPRELGNSLQYYQEDFGGDLPTKLWLAPTFNSDPKIIDMLRESSGLAVDYVDVTTLFDFDKPCTEKETELCLATLGGAIRDFTNSKK